MVKVWLEDFVVIDRLIQINS